MKLSSLLQKFYCLDFEGDVDPVVGIGMYMAGVPYTAAKPLASFAKAAEVIKALPGFKPPRVADVLDIPALGKERIENDLYEPAMYEEDGVYHIVFPGHGNVLSSSALAQDWRYLVLAAPLIFGKLNRKKDVVIFEVFYGSGHVTQALVKCSTWNIFEKVTTWATGAKKRYRSPGEACMTCRHKTTCKEYEDFHDLLLAGFPEGGDDKVLAQRLLNELEQAKSHEKLVVDRRKELGRRFAALAVEGKVNVNNLLWVDVKPGSSDKFPTAQVFDYLVKNKLWSWDLARINVRGLKKIMPRFPQEIQDFLESVKFTETTEPRIQEITNAVPHSVQAPLLRGISLS